MRNKTATAPNFPQAIRVHFGIGFGPLSGWLGISEGALAQAASGRRELATAAMVRLLPLAKALPAPWNPTNLADPTPSVADLMGSAPVPLPAWPHAPSPAALRQRLDVCRHLLLSGERALAPLLRRQAQARRLGAVLPALAAAHPPATDARSARWLPLFEARVAE